MTARKRLGVIYGGKSSEHEVSVRTAFSILEAVDYTQFEIWPVYIRLDGSWVRGQAQSAPLQSERELRLEASLSFSLFEWVQEIDVVFPVVHGPFGEDGTLQGLLEMLDVPYVGSGVLASAQGMDKCVMKKMFALHHIPQGDFIEVSRRQIDEHMAQVCDQVESEIGWPCFVKPANLGSSIGISKVKTLAELAPALLEAARFDSKVIVEQFINGQEIEIGVLGNDDPQTSVVGEIVTQAEFYDYEAKYKNKGTDLIIPATLPHDVVATIRELAVKAFAVLGCAGLARVDFFYDEQTGRVFVNEINTMPGFTPSSMYPLLFKHSGLHYAHLIEKLIDLALEAYERKKHNQIKAESLE